MISADLKTRMKTGFPFAALLTAVIFFAPLWLMTALAFAVAFLVFAEWYWLLHSPRDAQMQQLAEMFPSGDKFFYLLLLLVVGGAVLAWFYASYVHIAALVFWTVIAIPSIAIAVLKGDVAHKSVPRILQFIGMILVPLGFFASLLLMLSTDTSLSVNPRGDLFFIILLVACSDIFAYLGGRAIQGIKLVPAISPGKTWSGCATGITAAVLLTAAAAGVGLLQIDLVGILLLGATAAILGIVGDLFESLLKRSSGIKDSGALLAGHGGMFDRVDAHLITVPTFVFALPWFIG